MAGGALHICTGGDERKARNPACAVTAGSDALDQKVVVVVEGSAVEMRDEALRRRLANAQLPGQNMPP